MIRHTDRWEVLGFLLALAVIVFGYIAFNMMPIDRWRWRLSRWWARRSS
jgi:hypothetical protein